MLNCYLSSGSECQRKKQLRRGWSLLGVSGGRGHQLEQLDLGAIGKRTDDKVNVNTNHNEQVL